jgi:hypothetical protein
VAAGGAAAAGVAGASAATGAVTSGGVLGALFAKPLAIGIAALAIGGGAVGVYASQDAPLGPGTALDAQDGTREVVAPARATAMPGAEGRRGADIDGDVAVPALPGAAERAPADGQPLGANDAPPGATPTAAPSAPPRGTPLAATPIAATPVAATPGPAKPAALPSPAGSAPASPEAPTSGRDLGLAAERALIERAHAAIAQGRGADALAALDEHARQHPRGRLGEERETLRIRALAAAGRLGEARQRAQAFKQRFPQSLMIPVLEQAVGPLD